MATLNVKDFPDDLLKDIKAQADRAGMTLKNFTIRRMRGEIRFESQNPVPTVLGSPAAIMRAKAEPVFQDAVLDYSETQGDGGDLPDDVRRAQVAEYERRQRARRPGVQR